MEQGDNEDLCHSPSVSLAFSEMASQPSSLMASETELTSLKAKLDTMRGLNENGGNEETAQLFGTIHIGTITGAVLKAFKDSYPDITIVYEHLTSKCYYYNYNGTTLLYTATATDGSNVSYRGSTPTKPSSISQNFTFIGWATEAGGVPDPDALDHIIEDRSVFAHYAESTRYYTVRFFSGDTLLDTQYVAYGGYAAYYDSDTGSNAPAYEGPGDPEDYQFTGWDQDISYITHDVDTYAEFTYAPGYARKYLENRLKNYTDQNSLTDVGAFAFAGNTALAGLNMPDLVFSGGQVPRMAFAFVSNLESYTFGPDFSAVTEIGDRAFQEFIGSNKIRDISNVIIPQTMVFPKVETVGERAFFSAGYVHLHMPKATAIGNSAFQYADAVTLDLPSLAAVGTTSQNRFTYMGVLENFILSGLTGDVTPTTALTSGSNSSLKMVDCGFTTRFSAHMRNYTNLETVILRKTSLVTFSNSTVYSSGIFAAGSPIGQGTGKIYVPEALVASYQAAAGWSRYSGCFTAIEGSEYE